MIKAVVATLLLLGSVACGSTSVSSHDVVSSVSSSDAPTASVARTWPVPIDSFTPGSTVAGCTYPRTTVRGVLTSTKEKVASEYGYTGPAGLNYLEYDHRIPFSLCGSDGASNLWPEQVDGVRQTTYVHNRKDQLEAYAASQVRYHHWSLAFAQNVFRGDWRAAWCKYLHYPGVDCSGLS